MGGSICLWYLHVFSMHWYFLISSYYVTVSNGHSLTALKSIEVTQCSGSFEWGVHLPLVSTSFLYALVFPYIFLLFDCFEWALIDCIEKRRGHSVLWQFRTGRGGVSRFTLNLPNLSSPAVWCSASQKVFSYTYERPKQFLPAKYHQ